MLSFLILPVKVDCPAFRHQKSMIGEKRATSRSFTLNHIAIDHYRTNVSVEVTNADIETVRNYLRQGRPPPAPASVYPPHEAEPLERRTILGLPAPRCFLYTIIFAMITTIVGLVAGVGTIKHYTAAAPATCNSPPADDAELLESKSTTLVDLGSTTTGLKPTTTMDLQTTTITEILAACTAAASPPLPEPPSLQSCQNGTIHTSRLPPHSRSGAKLTSSQQRQKSSICISE